MVGKNARIQVAPQQGALKDQTDHGEAGRYDVGTLLGKGAFAEVFRARDRKNGQLYALKIVDIDRVLQSKRRHCGKEGPHLSSSSDITDVCLDTRQTVLDTLIREVTVHRAASSSTSHCHPNIVSFIGSFLSSRNMSMVLEYCPLGDLQSYMKRTRNERRIQPCSGLSGTHSKQDTLLCEDDVQHILCHVLRGLAFLHARGIAHRDIKAGNIFICPNSGSSFVIKENELKECSNKPEDLSLKQCTFKIGDFGLAVQMQDDDDWDDALHTVCGTPSCLAPEVALSTPAEKILVPTNARDDTGVGENCSLLNMSKNQGHQGHGQPADLWSTGCLLYAMLIGRYPFSLPKQGSEGNFKTRDQRVRDTIERALRGDWFIPESVTVSEHARALLIQLLSREPSKRGFPRSILGAHPFFQLKSLHKSQCRQFNGISGGTMQTRHRPLANSTNLPRPPIHNQVLLGKEAHVSSRHAVEIYGISSMSLSNRSEIGKKERMVLMPKESRSAHSRSQTFQELASRVKPVPSDGEPYGRYTQNAYFSSANQVILQGKQETGAAVGNETVSSTSLNGEQLTHAEKKDSQQPGSICSGNENDKKCSAHEGIAINVSSEEGDSKTSFLNPIDGLNLLPPIKHQWKEARRRVNDPHNSKSSIYNVYFLSEQGVVVTCEATDTCSGTWMHITGDGLQVCARKLNQNVLPSVHKGMRKRLLREKGPVLIEAFSRAPRNIREKYLCSRPEGTGSARVLSSPSILSTCVNMSFSTGVTSVSGRSLPLWSHNNANSQRNSPYKPLSSLLSRKNKSYLSLYRKLEVIINSIKQSIPKITVYIHSPGTKSEMGGLMAKAMLMESSHLPVVETIFVDGVTIRYQVSSGQAELLLPQKYGGSTLCINFGAPNLTRRIAELSMAMPELLSAKPLPDVGCRKADHFSNHIKVAQAAAEECLCTETAIGCFLKGEQAERAALCPAVKRIVARGLCRQNWVAVNEMNLCSQDG
uniref:Protein kinase domain-containing protein n=1 Tax=Odontella aurita TaxID=265563 RepID=A0A7S4HY09_9STRA|mmetsp:Transcript_16815/g.48457  ORF Transcript_16815/g.48457 Transcript_16815/m.48457 type:complete len:985 (+) Transcript_16815:436-3390(+)